MRNLLAIALSLLLVTCAVGQTPHRVTAVRVTPEMYETETFLYLQLDNAILLIDNVYNDTTVVFAKTFWSNKNAPEDKAMCFTDANEGGLAVDSLFVGVVSSTGPHIFGKMLRTPGQTEYVGVGLPLKSGRVIYLREVTRRFYECGVSVWFFLAKP